MQIDPKTLVIAVAVTAVGTRRVVKIRDARRHLKKAEIRVAKIAAEIDAIHKATEITLERIHSGKYTNGNPNGFEQMWADYEFEKIAHLEK